MQASTRRPSALLVVGVLALVALRAMPAAASGDATLDRWIVGAPGPEWVRGPSSVEEQLVEAERRAISGVVSGRVVVAARAWSNGNDDKAILVLIATPRALPDGARQARAAIIAMCASATSNPPSSIGEFAAIPQSVEAVCSGQNASGKDITGAGIAWPKKNVLVLIGGAGLTTPAAENLATRQDAAIPASGVDVDAKPGRVCAEVKRRGRAVKPRPVRDPRQDRAYARKLARGYADLTALASGTDKTTIVSLQRYYERLASIKELR